MRRCFGSLALCLVIACSALPGARSAGAQPLAMLDVMGTVAGASRASQSVSRLTSAEAVAIDHLLRIMPSLSGSDGRFDLGDVEPVVSSVYYELVGEVMQDVMRRAGTAQENAVNEGLRESRSRVRSWVAGALGGLGTTRTSSDMTGRMLSLDEAKRIQADLGIFASLLRRAEALGAPHYEFPEGISTADVRAVKEGTVPPSGRVASPRPAAPAHPAQGD